MTDFKNKRHRQVWPLFVKCVQIRQLIQLLRFASFQTYTLCNTCAASTLIPLNALPAAFPLSYILSPTAFSDIENRCTLSLSLSTNNPLPCSNNLDPHLINLFPMESTGKCSYTTRVSAQGSKRVRWSLLPAVLPGTATANRAPISGTGFESLPPLPIASVPLNF